MKLSDKEKQQGMAALKELASAFIADKNKIAKAISAYLRNQLEDFHIEYLSDEQMRYLNPLIRNAIFSFLVDYGDDYSKISYTTELLCSKYVECLTTPFLKRTLTDNIYGRKNETCNVE